MTGDILNESTMSVRATHVFKEARHTVAGLLNFDITGNSSTCLGLSTFTAKLVETGITLVPPPLLLAPLNSFSYTESTLWDRLDSQRQ